MNFSVPNDNLTSLLIRPVVNHLRLEPTIRKTVPNLLVVKLGCDGTIDAYNSAESTNVIIDVSTWYS